jgi:murein DD-endopeptidase MepM/ murein hydrolase activator NlpD
MRENMSDEFERYEPLPDHLADTGPSSPVRDTVPFWRRALGLVSLLGAVALTIATALLLILPGATPVDNQRLPTSAMQPTNTQPSQEPLVVPTENNASPETSGIAPMPTLNPAAVAALLSTPIAQAQVTNGIQVVRDTYNPYTIIPDRPRSEVIEYEVVEGDTIFTIAERFGLKPESIAWANDRTILGGLRPGRIINIMPVDGAYYTVPAAKTVQAIADEFHVDPYAIIDSEFNDLFGTAPDTELSSGTQVVVPGGEAEQISWNPVVETSGDTSSGSSGAGSRGGQIIFEPGDPGSCGWTDNPGGGGGWQNPMGGGYRWTQGFSSFHTGVDLAAPVGTPVRAANGGTVIFAGWNSWGYGYAVVLAHGPFMTVYGHMSDIYAGCKQWVDGGTVIGAVGQSGNASGPHLHFEIRNNNVPQDPSYTIPF